MFNSKLITRAELPNLTTMFGNLGHSWDNALPNDLYIKGVPKNIFSGSGVGNQGAGLDVLFSFSFPAKSFNKDGANGRIILDGFFGVNDNNKRIAVGFDSTTIIDTGLIDIDNNGFRIILDVMRISSTVVALTISVNIGAIFIDSAGTIISTGSDFSIVTFASLSVANMDTNSIGLLLTGESGGAANDDVVCNQVLIDLVRL